MSDREYDPDEELLDVQTEQPGDDVELLPVDPVGVAVVAPVVTVAAVPQHVSTYTVVTSTDRGRAEQVLPLDPLRRRATIIVHDQPVVLCHTQAQALAAANRAPGAAAPSGAYVWAGPTAPAPPIVVEATQELWVAPTWDQPARITVIAERRTA